MITIPLDLKTIYLSPSTIHTGRVTTLTQSEVMLILHGSPVSIFLKKNNRTHLSYSPLPSDSLPNQWGGGNWGWWAAGAASGEGGSSSTRLSTAAAHHPLLSRAPSATPSSARPLHCPKLRPPPPLMPLSDIEMEVPSLAILGYPELRLLSLVPQASLTPSATSSSAHHHPW